MRNYAVLIFVLLLSINSYASGESYDQTSSERILNFHSDIKIEQSGRVVVTETIRINVTNQSIKNGIIRKLPIHQANISEINKNIEINILSVKRDGVDEDYSAKREGNNIAVKIGNPDRPLSPNIYEYLIEYESFVHISSSDDHDEIEWYVTGNNWTFPINSVSATVHIPSTVKILDTFCYTHIQSSRILAYTTESINDSTISFNTTNTLYKGDGLTIALYLTPLVYKDGNTLDNIASFLSQELHSTSLDFYLFLLFLFIFLVYIWNIYRKNEKQQVVIPTINPPKGKSPAQLRYLYKKVLGSKAMTASIVSLAVKGMLKISSKDEIYTIKKTGLKIDLPAEEEFLYNKLFESSNTSLEIKKQYNSWWKKTFYYFEKSITKTLDINEYYPNKKGIEKRLNLFSISLLLIWIVVSFAFSDLTVFSFIFSIILTYASIYSISIYRSFFKDTTYLDFFIITISILFFALYIFTIGFLFFYVVDPFVPSKRWTFVLCSIIILSNFQFKFFHEIRTKKGAKIKSEIEGLKMYLNIAEKNNINFLTPPRRTPQQFEKMLPYAIALDLEIEWAKQFSKVLERANYKPTWYDANVYNINTDFDNLFCDSLTLALVSATHLPSDGKDPDDKFGIYQDDNPFFSGDSLSTFSDFGDSEYSGDSGGGEGW